MFLTPAEITSFTFIVRSPVRWTTIGRFAIRIRIRLYLVGVFVLSCPIYPFNPHLVMLASNWKYMFDVSSEHCQNCVYNCFKSPRSRPEN